MNKLLVTATALFAGTVITTSTSAATKITSTDTKATILYYHDPDAEDASGYHYAPEDYFFVSPEHTSRQNNNTQYIKLSFKNDKGKFVASASGKKFKQYNDFVSSLNSSVFSYAKSQGQKNTIVFDKWSAKSSQAQEDYLEANSKSDSDYFHDIEVADDNVSLAQDKLDDAKKELSDAEANGSKQDVESARNDVDYYESELTLATEKDKEVVADYNNHLKYIAAIKEKNTNLNQNPWYVKTTMKSSNSKGHVTITATTKTYTGGKVTTTTKKFTKYIYQKVTVAPAVKYSTYAGTKIANKSVSGYTVKIVKSNGKVIGYGKPSQKVYVATKGTAKVYWFKTNHMPKSTNKKNVKTFTLQNAVKAKKKLSTTEHN